MMEIVAALYLKVANHDPNVPDWAETVIASFGRADTRLPRCISGWNVRVLSAGRRGHAAQAVLAVPGASALAEAAGQSRFRADRSGKG